MWAYRTVIRSQPPSSRQKAETHKKFSKKTGGDGKRQPLTPSPFPAPWTCRSPSIETPTHPVPVGPLITWPENASCSRIPPRASRNSFPLRRWATTCCWLPLRPCNAPLPCNQQPLLMFSLSILNHFYSNLSQLRAIVIPFHCCWITETKSLNLCVCPYLFLFCLCCSNRSGLQLWVPVCKLVVITKAILQLLLLSIVSWQCQKCSTILILLLCLLCVTTLVWSSYSSFAPPSPCFNSWWQRDWEQFTYTLVLRGCPSMSLRQPQMIHLFANSRIGMLWKMIRTLNTEWS